MKLRFNIFYISMVIIFLMSVQGQSQFLVNIGIGGTAYQGDISPFSIRASFQGTELAYHAEVGLQVNEFLKVKIGYLEGSFGAHDRSSFDEERAKRNLSFKSEIKELFISSEIDIIEILSAYKYNRRFKPFFKFGVGLFHFNPLAFYQGEWVALQPLGTEGQGMDEFPDRTKYSRYQLSIPFGLGLEVRVHEQLSVSIQLSPRWTFTDYLDDVSISYPDYYLLKDANGEIAADLSDRSWEIYGEKGDRTGFSRGNPESKDWYFYAGFDIIYNFDMRLVKSIFNKNYRMVSCKFY